LWRRLLQISGRSQGNTVEAEAFAVNLAMDDDVRGQTAITIPQTERLVRDTASVYCPQYNR